MIKFSSNASLTENRKKLLRKEVLSALAVAKPGFPVSSYEREFPPIGGGGCLVFPEFNTENVKKYKSAIEKMNKIYRDFNIPLPNNIEPLNAIVEDYDMFDTLCNNLESLLQHCGIPDVANFSLSGEHGYGLSFNDGEIKKVYKSEITAKTGDFPIRLAEGKHTVLQQSTRSSTAAATAMLALDKGKKNYKEMASSLKNRELGNTDVMIQDLRKQNLNGKVSRYNNLSELEQNIKKFGPAIVSIESGIGGHVIIVDKITKDVATIRDPYHGWMIDISSNVLEKKIEEGSEYIQIKS
jgi:hypothetical protein